MSIRDWIAGSRIGWGIVSDSAIADLMRVHIANVGGLVQENQLRATHLLQHVLSDQGDPTSTSMHLHVTSHGLVRSSLPQSSSASQHGW